MCALVFWREGIAVALLPCPGFLWLEPGKEAEPDKRLILLRTPVKGTECPSPFVFNVSGFKRKKQNKTKQ